jgi:peptidoglycan hydrolase-like protein with peptidoglycan-binding domain
MSQSSNNEAAPASESQIKQVQEQLKANGLYKGEVDGKMGPETKQAISQFQQQNGLQQSGSLDQQTLSALSNNQNTSGSGTGANPGRSSSGSGSLNNSNSNSSSAGTGTGSNSILGTGGSSMGGSTAGSAGSATGGSTGSATGGSSGR